MKMLTSNPNFMCALAFPEGKKFSRMQLVLIDVLLLGSAKPPLISAEDSRQSLLHCLMDAIGKECDLFHSSHNDQHIQVMARQQ